MVIVTKEVALQYYRSEDKLYRLFLDYERAYEWARPVLERQIRYITEEISSVHWSQSLSGYLREKGFLEKKAKDYYFYYSEKSESEIMVNGRFIYYYHMGPPKEEWDVFDGLKKLSPYVFAMNMERETFGWLRPLKVFSVL